MPSTFGPGLAVDPVTLAPVPNTLIRVMDTENNVEYTPQDLQGNTHLVFTDHRGQYPQFQIPESVPAALLVSPPYMQRIASLEVLQRASQVSELVDDLIEEATRPRFADNGDGTITLMTSTTITDAGDGTLTIGA